MCIAFFFSCWLSPSVSPILSLPLIPILCPMLLANELMLFQFHMLAALAFCLSVPFIFILLSFSLLPPPPLPFPPTSILSCVFTNSPARFSWLFLKGNGDEERHAGWFPSATYLREMGLRKSDPIEFIMRIANPFLCERKHFFLLPLGGGRGVCIAINLLRWSWIHWSPLSCSWTPPKRVKKMAAGFDFFFTLFLFDCNKLKALRCCCDRCTVSVIELRY